MSTPSPTLTQNQMSNLAKVCSIGADGVQAAADAVEGAGFVLAKVQIEKLISEAVGEQAGNELATFLFGVTVGSRQDPAVPDMILRRISDYMATQPADSPYRAWDACRPHLARLLGSQSVRLAAKAVDVSYDFERIYLQGRFVTSMRPVFDEAREEIMGAAIVQTLRLEYFSGNEAPTTLSIALDRADIEQLRQSCDEALRKGTAASRQATVQWKLPVIMSGEDLPS